MSIENDESAKAPLLEYSNAAKHIEEDDSEEEQSRSLSQRVWIETKKLWGVVGPAIISRLASYTMFVVTQAFSGHLGDTELAAMSIASNVIMGFDFGLMLGMASALETLCGQAYGARKYHMLGIYLQRSWIVLSLCCVVTLPLLIFAAPILKLLGQPADVSELSGVVALCFVPLHFSFAIQFPLQRFLQCQLKNAVIAWMNAAALTAHVLLSWLVVYKWRCGLVGASLILNFSWWFVALGLFAYAACGGCPMTWTGFSREAFSGLWDFLKLSASSRIEIGLVVFLCLFFFLFVICYVYLLFLDGWTSLENWYYKILVVMTGNLKNAKIAVDALSVCMSINGWELMIPLAFFAGTGVRVANELGAGNGKGARFATIVAVTESVLIGLVFWVLIMFLHNELALIYTTSKPVLEAVSKLSLLLAFTVLFNSVQPILSGVAVGSGWQAYVAYINLGCYYCIGLPLGFLMGWVFHQGVMGIWAGMIFGGTAFQTLILVVITLRCDWGCKGKITCYKVVIRSEKTRRRMKKEKRDCVCVYHKIEL